MKSLFLFLLPIVVGGCIADPAPCSAEKAGFGDAPVAPLRVLPLVVVPEGNACRVRLDVITSQADFAAAYAELGVASAMPPVDFGSETVLVRVNPQGAGIQWSVRSGAKIVIGLQGCEISTASCNATFVTTPSPAVGVEARTCDKVHCTFVPTK